VYHIPTRKLSWRSTDADYKAIIEKADAIIDRRTDRKGIIHTVSYARSKRTLQYSRHAARFIWNETGSALADKLVQFRNSDDRNILVTPSVEEGFDFPDTEAEYQILLKFPFPNETNRVIKERCLRIPGYRLQYAAQKVTQIRGRAVRSYTDRSELFILDNSVAQLNGQEGRGYMPPGFRMWTVNEIPKAPPRIVL
jgi:Rad3-related DNA helicase